MSDQEYFTKMAAEIYIKMITTKDIRVGDARDLDFTYCAKDAIHATTVFLQTITDLQRKQRNE